MKLSVFLFLLLFMLPRAAVADCPPVRWNPRTKEYEYDPCRDRGRKGYDPRKDPSSEQFVPELVGLRDPRYDEEEKEKKEGKAALLAMVSILGVLALSRPQRPEVARPEVSG